MYEHRLHPPLSRGQFALRVVRHFGVAATLILCSLGIGILGYRYYENLAWRDAFLNAAMLLGGMGPVNAPVTPAGKLFAGCYALYAGLVFIVTAGIMFTPVVHRLLHRFHWEERQR
jgi:predicted membrane-bound spermidine synthase